jgi:hypothetical protein
MDKNAVVYSKSRTLRLRGVYLSAALGGLLMLACGGSANDDEADGDEDPSIGGRSITGGATGVESGGTGALDGGGSSGASTGTGGSDEASGGAADASGGAASAGAGGSADGTGGSEVGTDGHNLGEVIARVSLSEGYSSSLRPNFWWEFEGESSEEPIVRCPSTQVGACWIADCLNVIETPEPGAAARLHAGKIVFTVDNAMVFETVPEAPDNLYSVVAGVEFAGGEQISFTAEGGTVEAFSGVISLPLVPMILTPAFSRGDSPVAEVNVDSSQDFELTWDVRDSSQWIVIHSRWASDEPTFSCEFDASTGAGVIPSEVLTHVGAGALFEGFGVNYEKLELENGFIGVFGIFDLVNEARDVTPVFIVQ